MKSKMPPSFVLPEGIIKWIARYSGNCRCGKRIRQGQSCLYDKQGRKLICQTCARLPTEALDELLRPAAAGKVMDRIKQIYVMPKPLSNTIAEELQGLLLRLRTEFAGDYSARRLLVEVLRLRTDDDIVCIAMRYPEKCHSCAENQLQGTAAIWRKSSHRIWCLECYSAGG